MKAESSEHDDLLNDTPTSSLSPQAEMAMRWVCHFSADTIHTGSFHRKGYLMLHHLAGATIQVANLVNYRPLVKSVYQKNIFLISQPNYMLWVLKRTVSMRRFF